MARAAEQLFHEPYLPLLRDVVAVDDWRPRGIEQIGSKPKVWLESPTGQHWLFKETGSNRSKAGPYIRGDDWAEVAASEIARRMGLPAAATELASYKGRPGVISRSVTERRRRQGLVHGNELLGATFVGVGEYDERIHYTVDAVMNLLADVPGPFKWSRLRADDYFVGYLTFDAIVGNTDRHHQNWGVIRDGSDMFLAPSFDHASSLGYLLSDEERQERLQTRDVNRTVVAYSRRARCPFVDAPTPLRAALAALTMLPRHRALAWLAGASTASTSVDEVLGTVPSSRLSDPARRFASKLVRLNHERLADEWRKAA